MAIKINEVISAVNNAPSGSFIGITDYVSSDYEVSSVTGQIGVSYGNAKAKAVKALELAIETKDFKPIKVTGVCRQCPATKEFNSRKRSWPMASYALTFDTDEVLETAKQVLESYRNAEKKDNKIQLSEKENGVYIETETDNINITVLVANQTYKELESKVAKSNADATDKIKATMPESELKKIIRERFAPKMKSFTLKSDNFAKLTIGGKAFE